MVHSGQLKRRCRPSVRPCQVTVARAADRSVPSAGLGPGVPSLVAAGDGFDGAPACCFEVAGAAHGQVAFDVGEFGGEVAVG